MTKALVPGHFLEPLRERLRDEDVKLIAYDAHGNPLRDSGGASILFRWWLSQEEGDRLIEQHQLEWIHTGSAGVDHILTPRFLASGIVLTNSAGVHAASIAEWVVAAMLMYEKNLPEMLEQQRGHVWEKVQRDEMKGKIAVFLGAGHIAREIAARLRPFGVKLRAIRRRAQVDAAFDESFAIGELSSRVQDADWLIVTAPLTSSTRGVVNGPVISRLPPRCRFVNVARGEIVDEPALTDALREGRLAGAILDVFSEEPLPDDHPLWDLPGVLVLPHTTWRSPQVQDKQLDLFEKNVRRFLRGEALVNVVDVKAGY